MKSKITESKITSYFKKSGGYETYVKSEGEDAQLMRNAAVSMLEQFNGDVDKAVQYTKDGQNDILNAVGLDID